MGAQRYEIVERMASGAFGVVFRVRRTSDNAVFVMKRVPLQEMVPDQRHDAAQELSVMQGLHHPCVVAQQDAFLFNGEDLCLILEFFEGGDMDGRMAQQRELDAYFDFDMIMQWFVQLVLGAQYLHANHVVHRDIKTHNVFLRRDGLSVSLGDFGISENVGGGGLASLTWTAATMRLANQPSFSLTDANGGGMEAPRSPGFPGWQQLTWTSEPGRGEVGTPMTPIRPTKGPQQTPPQLLSGDLHHSNSSLALSTTHRRSPQSPLQLGKIEAVMKGTPLYMSPEVLQGGTATTKSDVWSLGCVLYELLTLRHPFEARDLAALVMRVTRGQREPLPAHYPRAIHDVVNRMLHLDPARRPSCEEMLLMPGISAYVARWRDERVALRFPATAAAAEEALAKQLAAWAINKTDAAAKHASDPRYAALSCAALRSQLQNPANAPSEERRLAEAAAAAHSAATGPFGSAGSAASSTAGATGGVTEGTFFYGDTGRRMVGGTGDPTYGSRPGDLTSFPITGSVGTQGAGQAMWPSESMRPHMVYDADVRSPSPPTHADTSPMRRGTAPGDGFASAVAAGGGAMGGRHPQLPLKRNNTETADDPARGSSPHLRRKAKPGAGIIPPPAEAPDAAPPFKIRTAPHAEKERTASHVHRLPHSTIDDETRFFMTYPNVEDMRTANVEDLASAVVELREHLQHRMRHQRMLSDIAQLHARHGSGLLRSMPRAMQLLETAADAVYSSNGGVRGASSGVAGAWASAGSAAIPNPASATLPWKASTGARVAQGLRQVRAATITGALHHSDFDSARGPSTRWDVSEPAPPLPTLRESASSSQLRPYLERRERLRADLQAKLGESVLRSVYAYYGARPVLQREPAVVRRLVPVRAQWPMLPAVEELVVLDRRLQPLMKR